MVTALQKRDYRVGGEESAKAQEKGLLEGEWYKSRISKEKLKELLVRKDAPAIRDTIIWITILIVTGTWAYLSWGTWWMIPAFLLYGNIYVISASARLHESNHGTAFKTTWMNDALFQLSAFMIFMQTTTWRASHPKHHKDTIVIGQDPEIVAERPPIWRDFLPIIFLHHVLLMLIRRSFKNLSFSEKNYLPAKKHNRTFWEARVYLLLIFGIWGYALFSQQYALILLVGFPMVYGTFINSFVNLTQHLGLYEDVLDYRLNTRTFYAGPIIRFLYWNMNYHIEHHMYPMVPFHALPALHKEIKGDCPAASPSFFAASKEAWVAMWKQRKDSSYVLQRALPDTANPYKFN